MSELQLMARVLCAVKQCEKEKRMSLAYFDERALHTEAANRDAMIVKLQNDEYVQGFFIIDDIDNQGYPVVCLDRSHPSVTTKGEIFIEENKPLRKAIDELKDIAVAIAAAKITNMLFML